MTTEKVYQRLNELLKERNWTLYRLANECKLPSSSLYNMKSRNYLPSLTTLDIICSGLGISICDFFLFNSPVKKDSHLTGDEISLLEITRGLSKKHQEILLAYANGLADAIKTDPGQ